MLNIYGINVTHNILIMLKRISDSVEEFKGNMQRASDELANFIGNLNIKILKTFRIID